MFNGILEAVRVDWENEGPGKLPQVSREWLYHMRTDESFAMYPRSSQELVDHSTHYRLAWMSDEKSIELARKVLTRLTNCYENEEKA